MRHLVRRTKYGVLRAQNYGPAARPEWVEQAPPLEGQPQYLGGSASCAVLRFALAPISRSRSTGSPLGATLLRTRPPHLARRTGRELKVFRIKCFELCGRYRTVATVELRAPNGSAAAMAVIPPTLINWRVAGTSCARRLWRKGAAAGGRQCVGRSELQQGCGGHRPQATDYRCSHHGYLPRLPHDQRCRSGL